MGGGQAARARRSQTAGRLRFATVLVDEATQATEAATVIPLCLGAQQCILVGDQNQLPPTVLSKEAMNDGQLGRSLFARLLGETSTSATAAAAAAGRHGPPSATSATHQLDQKKNRRHAPRGGSAGPRRRQSDGGGGGGGALLQAMMLTRQYRMHPQLAAFPSSHFYGGKLRSVPSPAERPRPEVGGSFENKDTKGGGANPKVMSEGPTAFSWPHPDLPTAFVDCGGELPIGAGGNSSTLPSRQFFERQGSGSGDFGGGSSGGGDSGTSFLNRCEARGWWTRSSLSSLPEPLRSNGPPVAGRHRVVTPYAAQARLIASC